MKRSEAAERVQNIYPLVNGGQSAPAPRKPDEEIKKIRWHMKDFHSQCLDRYKELRTQNGASTKLKDYAFPSVDDHQIPRRRNQILEALPVVGAELFEAPAAPPFERLHGIERADDLIMQTPQVLLVVAPLPECGKLGRFDELEMLPEMQPHLGLPLPDQPLRRHHQDSLRHAAQLELAQDKPGLDRLAEPHLVGQQVSVKGAMTVFSRLAEQFGEPLQTPITQLNRLPPLCERVAGASLESVIGCGMNRARAQALLDLSNAVARGWLRLQAGQEVAAVCKQLKSIRGIGDWTAQYIAMRVLRDADAFPASDLGLMKAIGVQRPRELLNIAEAWRPYRAYAAIHLWRSPGAGG